MSKPNKTFSSKLKAKVATEALRGKSIDLLASDYGVDKASIKTWRDQLKNRAELLFIEGNEDEGVLQNHAALLKIVIESSPHGIIITDLNHEIVTFNNKSVEMWDLSIDPREKRSLKEVMPHVFKKLKNPDRYSEIIERSFKNPQESFEDIFELTDGRFFVRYSVPCVIKDKIIGRVLQFSDITSFKKTEQKLSRYANLLDSINTNINEGILRSTPDKGLIYVNDAFVDIFGYESKEEVLNTDPGQFYAKKGNRFELLKELKRNKRFNNEEVLYKRKDGSTFWGLENGTMVEGKDGTYIDAVVTDIDTRKKAEEELRKSEEKYRTILKNIEEGYFETNLAGDFTFFNPRLVEMLGYPADEMLGKNNREYMDEKNAHKVFETFNKVYETGKSEQGFDWQLIRKDGSLVFVEASVRLRKNEDGEPIGFSGVVRNVTDRKEKEQQIRDSLKEKEVLLGEIHHRVKNNLAVISGLLYLQADKTEDEKAQKALMQSQNRINSMALIHELLYDNQTFSSLNPSAYIKQLVEHISVNLTGKESKITTEIEAENFDLEMSTAIPCALIINELITNAHKYAFDDKSKGRIRVQFRRRDDGYYELSVSDNGRGLPENFTIDESSRHSLGMSLVKTLTEQLRGELSVKSGTGATFIVTFPA